MPGEPYVPTDRRPLAARSWNISVSLAAWLARRGVAPNLISVVGMVASLSGGLALAATARWPDAGPFLWLGAGLLILVRGAANMLDGMVAIQSDRASPVGELFNEVPDRVSDSALLVGLGFAHGSEPLLGALAALCAVFTAYVRAACKVAGAPQDYRGPMAKTHRMAVLGAICGVGVFAPDWLATRRPGVDLSPASLALVLIALGCVVTSVRRLRGAAHRLRGSST
jgi:phosphatidylglycerophosphate synthase